MSTFSVANQRLEAARELSNHPDRPYIHGHSFQIIAKTPLVPLSSLQTACRSVLTPYNYSFLNTIFSDVEDLTLAEYFAELIADKLSLYEEEDLFDKLLDANKIKHLNKLSDSDLDSSSSSDIKIFKDADHEDILTKQKKLNSEEYKRIASNNNCLDIEIYSTQHEGAIWSDTRQSLHYFGQFSAAHSLPNVPKGHQCGRLHGHTFGVRLEVSAHHYTPQMLQGLWEVLHANLHHQHLNLISGLENPTSEMIARWIWNKVASSLSHAPVERVYVYETATSGCCFDGRYYRIWKSQNFEAAIPFDPYGRYTGHSYRVSLHLAGGLNEVMGWVEDFGDVKKAFEPVYQQLDHYALDQLPDLERYDHASIGQWILKHMSPQLPRLCRVDVYTGKQGVEVWKTS